MNRFVFSLLFFLTPLAGLAASAHPDETETFVQAEVPVPPYPAHGTDGRNYLVYEVHMTYMPVFETDEPAELRKVEVLEGKSGSKVLASFQGEALKKLVHRLGQKGDPTQILPCMRTIFFAFLPLESGQKIPSSFRHRLTFGIPAGANRNRVVECAPTEVSDESLMVIGPPMRGNGWFAVNGLGPSSPHRNAAIPYHGKTHIAQRFAIDWVQIDERGDTRKPDSDPKKNESYYCFGQDAIAVANGTVVAMRDGRPNNKPVGSIDDKANLIDGLGGNFAILKIADDRFAVYCHLQPGSFKVRQGDRIKRGQKIALVGNSGNSTEPHLHFHVADAPVIFDGEGVPYTIDSFEVQVSAAEATKLMDAHDTGKPVKIPLPVPGQPVYDALPLENEVVRFPGK